MNFFNFQIFSVPEASAQLERCRGGHGRRVLVVYERDQADVQADLEDFLSRVLEAVKLDMPADVSLLDLTAGERISFSAFQRSLPSDFLISFGLQPARLGLQLRAPLYQPFVHGQVHFLFSERLQLIYEERQRGGKEHSAALWKGMQALFL